MLLFGVGGFLDQFLTGVFLTPLGWLPCRYHFSRDPFGAGGLPDFMFRRACYCFE